VVPRCRPAKRYGGARGDQTDPWNWLGEISTVPRKEWPPGLARLAGDRASCAGPTGGSRIATTGRRPEFALSRSRGSPARIHGPSDRAYIEPSAGVAQQSKGYTAAHSRQEPWARDAGRPCKSNGCILSRGAERAREENNPALREKREPAPARLRFEENEWGGSPKRQAPTKLEGLLNFPAQPQLPQEPPAQIVNEQSSSEVLVESNAGIEGGSASVPGQASRVEAFFNKRAPSGTQGQCQRDLRNSRGRLDPRWRLDPRLSPRTTLTGHNILSTPFHPRLHLQGTGQLVREGLIMQ
jgi:hypothetical protein